MIAVWLALIQSLAGALGGARGALVGQIVNTIGTVTLDKAELEAFATPWIQWANAIVDANREPTPAEHEVANALADAVHANNQAMGTGATGEQLPLPPHA